MILLATYESDHYALIPSVANGLLRIVELKQAAKSLGFSPIKRDDKQYVVLEPQIEEPTWNLLERVRLRLFNFKRTLKSHTGLLTFKTALQLIVIHSGKRAYTTFTWESTGCGCREFGRCHPQN